MSGILNKLGLGHKDHATTDSTHHDSHSHHGKHDATTTSTTTTTTANSGLNQSAIGTTAPYGSSTNTSTTRSGAAYSDSGIASTGLASQTVTNQALTNQGIHQTGHLSGDNAMTRSEEQLRVAKATVETGKAELNKTVEHVHVEQAVPVQRERVVIEREPITQSNMSAALSGPAISEAHYETTLKEDRIAATKETVPIERIRLAKQVETHVESVGADLRKEHVDLTMHGVDNSKVDTFGRTTDRSLTNDKFDTTSRSGLAHDNTRIHDSNIHTASNTRNI